MRAFANVFYVILVSLISTPFIAMADSRNQEQAEFLVTQDTPLLEARFTFLSETIHAFISTIPALDVDQQGFIFAEQLCQNSMVAGFQVISCRSGGKFLALSQANIATYYDNLVTVKLACTPIDEETNEVFCTETQRQVSIPHPGIGVSN